MYPVVDTVVLNYHWCYIEVKIYVLPFEMRLENATVCTLVVILRSDLSWADQVNYTVNKAWRALHFAMRIFKKGNSNTKSLAYTSLVRPILEYGAAYWDPYMEGQISAIDRVQKRAAKFANHMNRPKWETLASHRKLLRICTLFKTYSGERA
jgi:hypothetical protein